MKASRVFILTAASGVLQLTLLHYFRIFGAQPDLLLITVFIAGAFLDLRPALGLSLLAGIFKDAFALGCPGLSTLLFPAWAFIIAKIMRSVSIEDNFTRALFIFVVALLNNAISGLAVVFLGSFVPLGIFLRLTIVGSIYTALISPLFLKLLLR